MVEASNHPGAGSPSPARHAIRIWLVMIALSPAAAPAAAEGEQSHRALGLAVGPGLAFPQRHDGQDVGGTGSGVYAEGDYIFPPAFGLLSPRLYAGLLIAPPDANCGAGVEPCDVSARIFFAGAKLRLVRPPPYLGSFLEVGFGASAGRISTRSGGEVDVTSQGILFHVPLALGVMLSRRPDIEWSFQYLVHPGKKEFCGGMVLGVTLDL